MYIASRTLVSQNLASAFSQLLRTKAFYGNRKIHGWSVAYEDRARERERVARKTTKTAGKENSRIKGQKTIGVME